MISWFSDTNEKLKEENRKLEVQFLEQKQQLEELNDRLRFYSRVSSFDFLRTIKPHHVL